MLTIGRIVRYVLTDADAKEIMQRRSFDPAREGQSMVNEGEEVAMIVTCVHSKTLVNGQAILDGNDSLWVTSVDQCSEEKPKPGMWYWPQ